MTECPPKKEKNPLDVIVSALNDFKKEPNEDTLIQLREVLEAANAAALTTFRRRLLSLERKFERSKEAYLRVVEAKDAYLASPNRLNHSLLLRRIAEAQNKGLEMEGVKLEIKDSEQKMLANELKAALRIAEEQFTTALERCESELTQSSYYDLLVKVKEAIAIGVEMDEQWEYLLACHEGENIERLRDLAVMYDEILVELELYSEYVTERDYQRIRQKIDDFSSAEGVDMNAVEDLYELLEWFEDRNYNHEVLHEFRNHPSEENYKKLEALGATSEKAKRKMFDYELKKALKAFSLDLEEESYKNVKRMIGLAKKAGVDVADWESKLSDLLRLRQERDDNITLFDPNSSREDRIRILQERERYPGKKLGSGRNPRNRRSRKNARRARRTAA